MVVTTATFGELVREWRVRRRTSQMDLALEAEISPRHLSFLETGRASPSRDMVLRLAETLAVPLRERNALLNAAGFAPVFRARPLDDPELGAARAAVDLLLAGHEPYPALAIDRNWTLVAANRVVPAFMQGCAEELLRPPINVLRLSLHPDGLAPRIANLGEWRSHLLERLRRAITVSGDEQLKALYTELKAYPVSEEDDSAARNRDYAGVILPFELKTPAGVLAFFSTTTVIGTPIDITLSELAIESFFPANEATAAALGAMAARGT
jgi:transcriptional regulator with XRE-family HTH domain